MNLTVSPQLPHQSDDLALKYLNISLRSFQEAMVEQKSLSLKDVGICVNVGIVSGTVGDVTVLLASRIGVIKSINLNYILTEMCITASKIYGFYFISVVLCPVVEEFVFRHQIQREVVREVQKKVIKAIVPQNEAIVDTTICKMTRIAFTAGLFAGSHFLNHCLFPSSYVMQQVISSFSGGIAYGALRESKYGLKGAIIAHIVNNAIAAIFTSHFC